MMPAMNRVRATRTNNRAVLFLDCSCVARKASGRRLGPIGPRQCRVLMLAARCGQGLLLLRLGDDGPIRRRADVATNELKLKSRAQEVSVQYFEHLFHEHASEGALGESRIVVIESIGPNDGATQAMASDMYDQRLSVLLFDDPPFLQGDVLGKNAEATIARLLATPF